MTPLRPTSSRSATASPTLLALLALHLGACGPSEAERRELDGRTLYAVHGCVSCHGPDGRGMALGPALTGLGEHWDRAGLAAFLADPAGAIEGDERLRELDRRYASKMRDYSAVPEAERLRIADYLLGLDSESR